MKLKSLFLSLAVVCMAVVNAQETKEYKPFPHMFVGLHGGVQTTFTNYNQGDLITPMVGVSFGGYFTPAVGARLHVSGWQNEYNYATGNVDLLLNLTNMFSKKEDRVFNVILLAGRFELCLE